MRSNRRTAVRWEQYRTRIGKHGLPGSVNISSGSEQLQGYPIVEIQINGQWVNVSKYVYKRDRIYIGTHGKQDESSQIYATQCTFTLNNRDGRFSPRKADGPYYGYIGRNTPVRVSIIDNGVQRFRFYGEIGSLPPQWDVSGRDAFVPIVASGIFRRLSQGNIPIKSAMYRGVTSVIASSELVDYWPMEDQFNATSLASANGGKPIVFTGTPTLSSSTVFAAAESLPDIGTSKFTATVRGYTPGNGQSIWAPDQSETMIRFFITLPTAGIALNTVVVRVNTSGSLARADLTANANGTLFLHIYDEDGVLLNETLCNDDLRGVRYLAEFEFVQGPTPPGTATTAQASFGGFVLGASSAGTNGTSVVNKTTGNITRITINPNRSDMTGVVIGHMWVQNVSGNEFTLTNQAKAYDAETAGARVQRLCKEENIEFHQIGAPDAVPASATLASGHTPSNVPFWELDDTVAMGAQRPNRLVQLFQECADADMGMLYEPKDSLAIGYRTRTSLYNQTAKLALDYSLHNLADSLSPVDDDQRLVNDITVNRDNGSSARATLITGKLSINPPPNGVGIYDSSVSINVQSDDTLGDQASWRLFLSTIDEARYPSISLNLKNPSMNQTILNGIYTLEVGDLITISSPPAQTNPDQIKLIVQGYSESFDQFEHTMEINCSSATPYKIGLFDSATLGRLDTDGSTLVTGVDGVATTLLVATTTTGSPLWTTDVAEFPFDVLVSGEVMTVTAISGSVSPQTFTVTRSINGVVKPQLAGVDIRLNTPLIIGL